MNTIHMPKRVQDNLTKSTQALLRAYIQNIEGSENISPQNDPEGVIPGFLDILEQHLWLKGNSVGRIDFNNDAHKEIIPAYYSILSAWVHHANTITFADWCKNFQIPVEFQA